MSTTYRTTFSFLLFLGVSGCPASPAVTLDTGSPEVDAGSDPVDTGVIPMDDTGVPETDTGVPMDDAGTPTAGACTNAADTAIHGSMDVSAAVGTCAEGCTGGGPCTTDCVVTATGLSRPCAQCYGDVTACTVMRCLIQCIGGDTPACTTCRAAMCMPAFATCAGI